MPNCRCNCVTSAGPNGCSGWTGVAILPYFFLLQRSLVSAFDDVYLVIFDCQGFAASWLAQPTTGVSCRSWELAKYGSQSNGTLINVSPGRFRSLTLPNAS